MDLLITFDHGIIAIEDMSIKARDGLRRENDVKSLFYFFDNEFTISEDENYYNIVGKRKGLLCIPENHIIPRDVIDAHHIPTKRLKKAIRNPLDIFRKKANCFVTEERILIPLTEIFKNVTITIPKTMSVRLHQGEWEISNT